MEKLDCSSLVHTALSTDLLRCVLALHACDLASNVESVNFGWLH